MKNTFDPKDNHFEWIQNDWESDDFIEQQSQRTEEQNTDRQTNPAGGNPDEKNGAGWWILAVLVYIFKNPLIWFVLVAVIIWKSL